MTELERNIVGIGRRPALVVIDMNNAFTDPASPLGSDADTVVDAVANTTVSLMLAHDCH